MKEIRFEEPKFYSETDETLFFKWFDDIESLIETRCEFGGMAMHFESYVIPDEDLRNILALFYRYKIDMKCLSVFLNDNNKWWFKNPIKYYYNGVFG